MDYILPIILIIAALSAGGYFIVKKLRAPKQPDSRSIKQRVFAITDKRTAPSGMQLWVETGANVTDAEITAIENGLDECFTRARVAGYSGPLSDGGIEPLSVDQYKVAIMADCIRSPVSQTWSYKIPVGPGNPYFGGEWDMGGFILAGGQHLASGHPHGNIIVLPGYAGDPADLATLSIVAGSEAEHVILSFYDGALFEQTKYHMAGEGHPLF